MWVKYRFTKKSLVKNKLWTNNITYVAPSKWLYDCAKTSDLLKNKEIKLIPNGIDMEVLNL